jgi:glycosyltransferase involved in cell wall biosynthesis
MSRIAYLVSEYPAASHTFIRREIAALRRRGLEIVPFSVRRPSLPARDEIGVVEHILGRPPLEYPRAVFSALLRRPARFLSTWRLSLLHRQAGLRGVLWSQFHFVEAMLLAGLLRKAGAARVHSHFANSGATVGLLAAHYLGLPWSLTLHGISETDHPAGALLPDKLARADFVACASWFMRAQAMRLVDPAHWSKFAVVRCGIDLDALPEVDATKRGAKAAASFICVGRLSAEKGYSGLLDAFAALIAGGADARLSVVGDGPLRAQIEARVRELGLEPYVRLLGALPEGETLVHIAQADVLVLPSLMEGLPVVLMEAMALGKPVIASCVAGIPELVRDGVTGLLFRPSDWEHLAERMQALLGDPAAGRRMAAAGRAAVRSEFAVDIAIQPLVQFFNGQTGGRGGAGQFRPHPDHQSAASA